MSDHFYVSLPEQVAEIIAFLSEGTTLLPGTVILTGTPEGVGFTRNPPVCLSKSTLASHPSLQSY